MEANEKPGVPMGGRWVVGALWGATVVDDDVIPVLVTSQHRKS